MSENNSIDSTDSFALTPTHKVEVKPIKKQKIIQTMQCIWKFEAQTSQELDLEKGDIVYVTDCLGDWNVGICERTSSKGYFPPNYCSLLEDVDIPMPRSDALRKILVFPEDEYREAALKIWRAYSNYKFRKSVNKSLAKIRHRKSVLTELLDGERAYVDYMKALKELYSIPLKSKLSPEEYKTIFSDFEVVINVANTFLQLLEEAKMNEERILQIFVTNSQFLKQYVSFVSNIDNSTAAIDAKCQKDKEFNNFLKVQKTDKRSNRQDLKSLLAKPFQRLIGYRNLIDRLRQLTPKESFRCELIEKAYQQIDTTIDYINEKKRHHDDQKTMRRIQSTLIDKIGSLRQNLIRGWRTPIYEGKLMIQKFDMNNFVSLQIFLMNDVLFFAKDKDLTVFYLSFTKISPTKDNPLIHSLNSLRQKCKIKFKDDAEKDAWVNAFRNAYESEKEYAKENGIHGSIHSMIKDYNEIISKNIVNFKEEIDKRKDSFEKSESIINQTSENIAEKKRTIEAILKDIINYQEERKSQRLKAEETRKDFFKMKTEQLQNIEKCHSYLQTFNLVLRRDNEAYFELFGEDKKILEEEKTRVDSIVINSVETVQKEEQVESKFIKTLDENSLKFGREFEDEMRSIRKLVQGIELEENSFNMISSSADMRKRLQESKSQNVALTQKVEELRRHVKSLEESLSEEKTRVAAIMNDSHSSDQIKVLTKTLNETEKKLVEIQGWKDQQLEIIRKNVEKDQPILLRDEIEKLKIENEKLRSDLTRIKNENETLKKQKLTLRTTPQQNTQSKDTNETSDSNISKSEATTKIDSPPPPIPPRSVASTIKDRAKLFEENKFKFGDKSAPPPPLPSRDTRAATTTTTTTASSKTDTLESFKSSPLTIDVISLENPSDTKDVQDIKFDLQQKKDQNDRLQNEIIELRKKLDESRKEKIKIVEEERERVKKLFNFQEEQLRHITESQEMLFQNNKALSEVLHIERSKAAKYETMLLELQKEKFEEVEKLWEQERSVDEFRSTVEKLRLELIQSQYKISFLERLVEEGSTANEDQKQLHRRSSATDLPKDLLSPSRANRRMSMAINATTSADIKALLNQKTPVLSNYDKPQRPDLQPRSVSPITDDSSSSTTSTPQSAGITPQSIDVEIDDKTDKKKRKVGFFNRKKKSPSRNEFRNTLAAPTQIENQVKQNINNTIINNTKGKAIPTSVSMSQFPQTTSSPSSTPNPVNSSNGTPQSTTSSSSNTPSSVVNDSSSALSSTTSTSAGTSAPLNSTNTFSTSQSLNMSTTAQSNPITTSPPLANRATISAFGGGQSGNNAFLAELQLMLSKKKNIE